MSFLNDPDTVLARTVDPAARDATRQMLAVAQEMVPSWANCWELEIEPVPGGITNQLFKLTALGRESLLLRIYGANTERIIDREAENRLFARLSAEGFAPPYLGRFENGRLEGFLEGFRPLHPVEMADPDLQPRIAAELARMHAIAPLTPEPRTWRTLTRWIRAARAVELEGDAAAACAALDLAAREEQLLRLKRAWYGRILPHARSPGQRAAVRPVLAHNDLLSGNILLSGNRRELRFIDYEYSACAPAAFDVANHFCEYAGFDSDFANRFPDRDSRDRFIAAYLRAAGIVADRTAVADFSAVVDFMVVVDHYWWGSWAVLQAGWSPIDFDFIGYAGLRFAGCDLHREQLEICWP